MRVLIIEDNPDIAANLGDYLEDHGHTVDFAGDGVTGLHLAVVNNFDCIVLDLALPGMDGLEVCRKLRTEADKDSVRHGDQEIYLNPIGLKLLQCLMEASPNVVSRAELEMEVWGEEMPDSDSLRVHIHSLRSAIDKPFGSNMIQTRHGIGYRLVDPDAVSAQA
jgi:DNA-binding response OmpR family regulator